MENTVHNTLATAQTDFVSWCLPGATNDVLLQSAQALNLFSQYVIALLTILMLLVMCVTLYTTLLSFKYKETTRHDWLVLGGAFGATMMMIYFWDFMRALHSILTPSPSFMFALLWSIVAFNIVFVGYYTLHALKSFYMHTARHVHKAISLCTEWYKNRS